MGPDGNATAGGSSQSMVQSGPGRQARRRPTWSAGAIQIKLIYRSAPRSAVKPTRVANVRPDRRQVPGGAGMAHRLVRVPRHGGAGNRDGYGSDTTLQRLAVDPGMWPGPAWRMQLARSSPTRVCWDGSHKGGAGNATTQAFGFGTGGSGR